MTKKVNESLLRDSTKKQMSDLKKQVGNDIGEKTAKGEENVPNTLYNHNPFNNSKKISTYETFAKNDSKVKTVASKSTEPKSKKICSFDNFTCEGVVNESTKSDFMLNYSDELKATVGKIKKMRGIIDVMSEDIFEETINKITKKMSRYDSNVDEQIDHWINSPSGDVDVDDIVNFALDNYNKFGTEPQFIIFAIDEVYDIINKDLNESRRSESQLNFLDDLKSNFRSYEENDNTEEDAEDLVSTMIDRHPDEDEDKIRKWVYHWCGVEKNLDESLTESKKAEDTKSHINTNIDNWIQGLDSDIIGTTDDKLRPMFVNRPNNEIRPPYDIHRAGKYVNIDGQDGQVVGLKNGKVLVDIINKDNKHEIVEMTMKEVLKTNKKKKKDKE